MRFSKKQTYPAQGHINPMLKFAKLLHHKGFHITFVITEYNHKHLLKSRGPNSLDGLPDFRFETIPDGLRRWMQTLHKIYLLSNCLEPFRQLLAKLNASSADVPPVTCVESDAVMSFSLDAAEELGLPIVLLWTTSACGFLAYAHCKHLIERGLVPLKDTSYLTNGYLETTIDWVPGMKNIRLRDFPSFIRTTDPNDLMLNFLKREADRAPRATALIVNTFEELEHEVVAALSSMFPPVYTIGPLPLLVDQIPERDQLASFGDRLRHLSWELSNQFNTLLVRALFTTRNFLDREASQSLII
ncbi:hypothetical protein Tsubulata_049279, partial [Turnera subulata]